MVGKKNVNVLCLDGGGVRGLSTLLILKELIGLTKQALYPSGQAMTLLPRDVFDLVVGTSTGGLIALMLVKLSLNVDDCIELYQVLSKEIFSHHHLLGVLTGGFGRVKKYCGKHLRQVLIEKVIKPSLMQHQDPEEYYLEDLDSHETFRCAVVCRELDPDTMDRKRECVFLCSRRATSDTSATLYHKCRMQRRDGNGDRVKVADAARATSAAPTYFSHVKLHNKQYLVDGGFGETNNPSKAAWDHYFSMRIHDYEQVNVINIGTGSEPEGYKRKKGWTDALPTSILRGFVHTIKGLAKLATESDAVGYDMKLIQSSGAKALNFSRFSANIGELHNIHLYEYQRQSDIIKLTEQYLGSSEVQSDLSNVAARLANSYRARNPEMFRTGHDTVPHTISQAGADIPNAPRRTSAAEPSERNEDITSDTSSITTSSHSGALGGQDAPYPRGQASAHPPSIFDRSLLSAPQSTPLTSINTSRRSSLAGGSPADRTKDTLPTSAHIGNTRDAGTAFT